MDGQKKIKELIEIGKRIATVFKADPVYQSLLPSLFVSCQCLSLVLRDLQEFNNFLVESKVVSRWIEMLEDTINNIRRTLREMVPKISEEDFQMGWDRLSEEWEEITKSTNEG